jgi:hypothetical protein
VSAESHFNAEVRRKVWARRSRPASARMLGKLRSLCATASSNALGRVFVGSPPARASGCASCVRQAGQIVERKHMRIVGGDHEVAFFARECPRRGHVGIDQALEHFRQDSLCRPLLTGYRKQWIGPAGSQSGQQPGEINTKSFRLERLRNGKSASSDPPCSGTGSGNMPAGRRKRTGGTLCTCQPSGPISTARRPR